MDLLLNVSQKLVLSQKMLLSTEILQMGSQELVEYIKELSVENPVVEYEERQETEEKYSILKKKLDWLGASDEQNKSYYKEEKNDESDNDNWKFKDCSKETLEDYLYNQIVFIPLKKNELCLVKYMIECIDSNGYFAEDMEDIARILCVSKKDVESMLKLIQTLEPIGVGGRNLKECLLIQIEHLNIKNNLVVKIIEEELETLGKNQIHILAKKFKTTVEDVLSACDIIKSLNPKPGSGFSTNKSFEYIIPDVIIVKAKENYDIVLNDYFFPNITINNYYKTIIKDGNDMAKEYVYNKIKQAEWAMKCISRRNATLLKTIESILEIQREFFERGIGNLAPMKLSDVSEKIELHESTVSRTVRDKYLQCVWGVFPLNYFFTSGIQAEDTSQLTSEKIKIEIKDIIDNEDKSCPLSDREIMETLASRRMNISRRTVAKYRESINILSASGRKGYK